MKFGYFPDFKKKSKVKDLYLRVLGYPFASRRIEAWMVLQQLSKITPDQKILDIGCGDGIWTNYLSEKTKAKIVGVDISDVDLNIARKRASYQDYPPTYQNQDASNLSFPNNHFDQVYSISTLEHTSNDQKIFDEVYRVLKPGGAFVISVPNSRVLPLMKWWLYLPKSLRFFLQSPIRNADTIQEYHASFNKKFVHRRLYNKFSIQKKAKRSGFDVPLIKYHISFFSVIPHSIIHSLRIFEWNKTVQSRYNFTSELLFAITFPFFYPLYKLDSLLPNKRGFALIAVLKKTNK